MLLSLLLYASFLANIGIGILNFSLVFYTKDFFHASPGEIGWMSSLWALFYFAGCFVLRRLSIRLGAKRALITASAGMAVFSFLILKSPSMIWIFVFYSLFGFTTALFWPTLEGWLSEGHEGASLNKRVGRFNLSWSFALVLSPYMAGLLVEKSLTLSLVVSVGLYSVLAVSFWFLSTFFLRERKTITGEEETEGLSADRSTPLRYIAWIGNFSTYMVNGIILFVFPLYARDVLGFTEPRIGFLLLLRALFSTAVFILTSRTVWWHFNKVHMILIQFLLAVFCFVLVFIHSWAIMAVMLSFFGVLFAFHYSNSLFHGVSGSINREGRMAVHEAVLTAGVITGAVSGGELYQRMSMHAVFSAAGFLLLLLFFVQIIVLQGQKRIQGKALLR